ncbi:Putative O-antigen transporter [Serratia grimesii]|uniref:flippase n=1 Tax=Serratia grimesii TaxID=82995 RepID=UPI00076F3590|nr:flippase [Serratia grimesii]CUW09608.1 Putative O-antigen transporter [Serratia grimesii]SMZ55938.1 Putative O-antigen transporter [Serratia grimesii]
MKNIISLIGIQGVNYIIPLITLPYLVRILQPAGYGSLGFSLAIIQYFTILTDYGFNLSVTQKIAVNRDDKPYISKIFWSVISCKLLLGVGGGVVLSMMLLINDDMYNLRWILIASYITVFGSAIFPVWLFQGKESMGWIALSNITARLTTIPLIFALVKQPEDAWMAGGITGMTSILAGCIALFLIWKNRWVYWIKPDWDTIRKEYQEGWHVFISNAAISLYTTSTTVILGFIAGPIAVGYFVAADKLRQAAQGLISPVSQSFFPRVNSAMAEDHRLGFLVVRKLLAILSIIGVSASAFLFVFSPDLIIIVYGENYEPAITVLRIISFIPIIICLSNVFGIQVLLVLGKKKVFSRVLILSGLVNLSILVPLAYYFKQDGAAISILVTEFFVTSAMLYFIFKLKIPLFKKEK